jgi:hypothetical protein
MSETAMAAALRRAGFNPETQLYTITKELLDKSHGAEAKASRLLYDRLRTDEVLRDAAMRFFVSIVAEDMRGAGQLRIAENGQGPSAPSPHTLSGGDASGGQSLIVQKDQVYVAADPSRGAGHFTFASDGHRRDVPPRDTEIANGAGHRTVADKASVVVPPARDTLTEAARVLRRAPGSGALQRRAYETRDRLRGESWLLTFTIPDGPRLLALTWGEAEAMGRRMAKEGGERMVAAAALAALIKEGNLLGRVSPDQIIEKTLSPAAIDRVAQLLEPEKLQALGRKATREFAQSHVEMIGAANG